MNVLFVTSEVYPLNKTGGLGDVAYSLPHSLIQLGSDVRLVIPAYRDLLNQMSYLNLISRLDIPGNKCVHSVRLFEATHPDFAFKLYLVDCQALFDRGGNPYTGPDGHDWADNAERYSVFARAVTLMAMDRTDLGWKPDVIQCNDWQSGLVPALLSEYESRPKTIFTIHNLAYGGHFSISDYQALQLPKQLWHMDGVEFYGSFSMLKAGIAYADQVTTVSPTYAKEICTEEFGNGMQGILQKRQNQLTGILNGIDQQHWNPKTDPYLPKPYGLKNVNAGKTASKQALLASFGLTIDSHEILDKPLLGMVGRLVEQKGIDLILDSMPEILETTDANFAFLGTGSEVYENKLLEAAKKHPNRVFVWIGFSEEKAHLLEAGADMFLMPSRFEPCGLNQMYSLKYGTPPIVHNTGGLADTVVNTNSKTLKKKTATGFTFDEASTESFKDAIVTALKLFEDKSSWDTIIKTGMSLDLSWNSRAKQYMKLFKS